MTLNLSNEDIATLIKLEERYFFGLFQSIAKSEQEEFEMRDALIHLTRQLKDKS